MPSDPVLRDRRCFEAYNIHVQGLVTRLKSSKTSKIVIGVSGGLDSTHALIVAARALDLLGLPRSHLLAYTMPGFATTQRTLVNAKALIEAIGCAGQEVDIRPSCEQMLRDIGHPYADGEPVYDVTFENVQARERTSHLFRFANLHQGLVLGTSDLSELALGWCTYGVGDHMSHYSVNASVPKTLVQFLIRWVADTNQLGEKTSPILRSILETEFSPELIPGDPNGEQPSQKTEDVIGPYELQDFNLYYTARFGYLPSKIAFLSYCAWRDRSLGRWPDIAEARRNQYTIVEIQCVSMSRTALSDNDAILFRSLHVQTHRNRFVSDHRTLVARKIIARFQLKRFLFVEATLGLIIGSQRVDVRPPRIRFPFFCKRFCELGFLLGEVI